ncbi:hypothetical protein BRM99_06755, partial [Xanthomonas oryzae pv. oryzae]
ASRNAGEMEATAGRCNKACRRSNEELVTTVDTVAGTNRWLMTTVTCASPSPQRVVVPRSQCEKGLVLMPGSPGNVLIHNRSAWKAE